MFLAAFIFEDVRTADARCNKTMLQ